ncbi:MAG: hypothetical protein HOL13_00155 [Phycisphaerae bacterium]|nr:hypothetical protein [Phycisphaerae bacterium]MBT5582389.1 hypothetical protein [Phycisphaerae bacterium]MBT5656853.1 hypothetical protein [Phycisphaerae bacterium]
MSILRIERGEFITRQIVLGDASLKGSFKRTFAVERWKSRLQAIVLESSARGFIKGYVSAYGASNYGLEIT